MRRRAISFVPRAAAIRTLPCTNVSLGFAWKQLSFAAALGSLAIDLVPAQQPLARRDDASANLPQLSSQIRP
jgi:hypothetical protein